MTPARADTPEAGERALDRLDAAEAAARKGLESNPDPRMAPLGHYVLADVYNRRGQHARAEAEAAKARRLEGTPARSWPGV